MPAENTRIIVRGTPKADRDWEVIEISREEGARLAARLVAEEKRVLEELKRANLRGRSVRR